MSKRTIAPIFIALEATYLLLGALLAVSSVAILIVWFYVDNAWLKAGLMLFVTLNCLYFSLRDALLLLENSWKTIEINALGELSLTNNHGDIFKPNLSHNTFIHPYLTVLLFNPIKNHQYLTVFKGQKPFFKLGLPPLILFNTQNNQQHRKLRVWLRWGKHAESDQAEDLLA